LPKAFLSRYRFPI